jgi:predicted 2-oxoglutarate/Fe(II)-dependent dioxygenase YbiX
MVSKVGLFSKEDCEYIKSFYDKTLEKNEKGFKITSEKYPEGIAIKDGSAVSWNEIQNDTLDRFLLSKLNVLDITSLPMLKLMRYGEGNEMKPHRDFQAYDTSTIYRSTTIQLSDPKDYEGGRLVVEGIEASNLQGTVNMFNPYQRHWVTKITKGERWVIVAFLEEVNFTKKKNLL